MTLWSAGCSQDSLNRVDRLTEGAQPMESAMLSSLSKLTPEQLEEIRSLEQKLGKTLLSFSSYDVVSDDLRQEDIAALQALEDKLGTMLVAVRELKKS